MALIYSYPLADEVTNESWVLGSEMDNGIRVVKNYSVGDIASFIQQEYTTIPTLQQVTEEGANTNVQIQIDGVDVATVNDIPGTPTLQEVVSEGNTVSGGTIKVELGSYYTSLEGVSVNVSSSSNLLSLYAGSVLFEKQFGTGSAELRFPNTIDGTRVIEFPNASGTIALTGDLSSFVPYTGATSSLNMGENNIIVGAGFNTRNITVNTDTLGGFTANVGGTSLRLSPVDLRLTDSAGGSLRFDLRPFGLTTGNNFTISFPAKSGQVAMLSDIAQVKTSSFTAVDNQYYYTTQTLTITDPAGSVTRGYIVYVIEGLATIGGVVYGAGSLVYRYQNGTTWTSTNMANPTPAYKVCTALLTQSGTNAPVVTVLENTIGALTIIRSGVGEYRIQSSGLFTLNKTTFDITPILGFIKQDQLSNINEITFITRDTSNITSDGLLTAKKLEIRVYN